MKKKYILIVVIVVVVIAILSFGIVKLLTKDNRNNNISNGAINNTEKASIPDLGEGKEFFYITTLEDVTEVAEKYDYKIEKTEYEEDILSVYGVMCCELPLQFDFISREDGLDKLQRLVCSFIPFASEYENVESPIFAHSASELKTEILKFFEMLEKVYSIDIGNNFYIINSNGELLSSSEETAYESIISGEAFIDFSLRDEKGNYWNLRSNIIGEGLIYLELTNYYDESKYSENIVNITVSESKKEG